MTKKSEAGQSRIKQDVTGCTLNRVTRYRTGWRDYLMKRSTPALGVTKKIQLKLVNPTFVTEQQKFFINQSKLSFVQ